MSDTPPQVSISPIRKVFFSGASMVWLIPIAALLVALGVAWQSYNARGPEIVIEFTDGEGIKAGETELRFRDVTVGKVEKVGFSEGLKSVQATVRVDKGVAPYIDKGAIFWIVQPEVSAQGISGLSTVLSGVYIEGSWDDQIGPYAYTFHGASEQPLIKPGKSGLEIAFRTVTNSQLTDNAPILYKGIEVGRVGRAKIAPRGNYAIVEALIYDEHRSLVNQSTRFWDTSGFSVSIGPAGAEINFSSLASLVGGGVTFDTFVSGGDRVQDGTVFEIWPDEESARNSIFNASEVDPLRVSVVFDDNISGLIIGAPVELSGLKVGAVESLSGIIDQEKFGDNRVRLNVSMSIQPARLGLQGDVTADAALEFLKTRVAEGLRARLASGSLLTGGLKIELVNVDDAPPAQITTVANDIPQLPTTKSEIADAAATVEGVVNRINNLPIEELLQSAIDFLDSAEAFVSDENLRETPQDLRLLLADVKTLVTSDDVQNIPVSLNKTLIRVEELVAKLEQERIVESLRAALDNASKAAETVSTSADGIPDLVKQIEAVAAKAENLELEPLIKEITSLVQSADTVLGAKEAAELPGSLKRALDELNYTLQELRKGGAVENVNQALASARNAADSIAVSTKDLPGLAERLTKILNQASRTIEGYNKGEMLSREAQATLRDIQKAADALASLARKIERNPNSLLLGK